MAPPYFLFKEVMIPAGKLFLRGLGQKSTIRYLSLWYPTENLLDFGDRRAQYRFRFVLPNSGSLKPFSEDVMKWAYLKMPDRCLPEANA